MVVNVLKLKHIFYMFLIYFVQFFEKVNNFFVHFVSLKFRIVGQWVFIFLGFFSMQWIFLPTVQLCDFKPLTCELSCTFFAVKHPFIFDFYHKRSQFVRMVRTILLFFSWFPNLPSLIILNIASFFSNRKLFLPVTAPRRTQDRVYFFALHIAFFVFGFVYIFGGVRFRDVLFGRHEAGGGKSDGRWVRKGILEDLLRVGVIWKVGLSKKGGSECLWFIFTVK